MADKTFLSPAQRRQRNRQEMIENILSIAREMMKADGVAALRFNAIARQLGMKPPSLYSYFPSKYAIYDALFRRGFEMFDETMRSSLKDGDTPFEKVRSALEKHLAFAQENQDLYQLMMQRPVPDFVPTEESMAVSWKVLKKSYAWIQQIFNDSDLDPDIPLEEASDLVFAMMTGLTNLHLANDPELPAGQGRFGKLAERAARIFFDAWQPKEK